MINRIVKRRKEVKYLAKKGAKYKCGDCGIVVVVDEVCGCSECDLVCCGAPMEEAKSEK